MRERLQSATFVIAAFFLLPLPLAAQITIGDNVNLTGNGNFTAGYTDTYGSDIQSSHGITFGGAAALNGFYYDPKFVSFNINPYYNQSRSNSDFGSITDASGVTLGSSIFSGSHFPGSINYSVNDNSTGNYGLPGITGLNTNGNSQTFGINWGEYVPGLPTLSASFQQGSSNYQLYGTNEGGNSHFDSFHLNSTYTLLGFGLSGGFSHGTSNSLIPGVLVDDQDTMSRSDTTTYVFTASHPLPWSGSFSTSFNRTDLNSDYLGYKFNGDIDVLTTSIGLHPTPKLSFSLSADYTDNLSGSLYEALIPGASGSSLTGAGTVANQSSTLTGSGIGGVEQTSEDSSHAWNFLFNTSYAFAPNLHVEGLFEKRDQSFDGVNFGSNLYSGGVYYNRPIAGGFFGTSVNIFDSTVDTTSQNELGFSINNSYGRRFGQWQISGYVSYVQNAQTLLVTYTSSAYSFSGSASRRVGRFYWTGSAGGGRTGLTAVPGSSNDSETFGTTFGTRNYNVGANYAKASGTSLAGGTGLITTPLPPVIPSNLLVFFGGQSYSVSASAAPARGLNLAFSYVNSRNNLANVSVGSSNNFQEENAYFQYQFRQLGLNGGYSHLQQGFSASGLPPASVTSFYIGVYRWFHLF